MKFVLLVEGHTERMSVPAFLKHWLDRQLNQPVGIQPVRFDGWQELVKDSKLKTEMHLNAPKADIIAVIALLDLYGPTIYPPDKQSTTERYEWAKQELERRVGSPGFHQFFAIHEVEAWLLSDPNIFPAEIRSSLKVPTPETINTDKPPAKLLDELYMSRLKRHYGKVRDGRNLFEKLDPATACRKCPALASLLDEMLRLAQE